MSYGIALDAKSRLSCVYHGMANGWDVWGFDAKDTLHCLSYHVLLALLRKCDLASPELEQTETAMFWAAAGL